MKTKEDCINKEYLDHNRALEQSPEYQKLFLEVEKEAYTQFTLEQIRYAEKDLAEHGDYEDHFDDEYNAPTEYDFYLSKLSNKIKEAKRLLEVYPDQPEHAANLFIKLGHCHTIWELQKRILKDKYGITWYAPSEIYPYICFD